MTIIIFIIILLVLVLIHETGHFFAAKLSGVRVDEFAFGFPPKLYSVKKGETNYVFNALPLGGYVKIFGENGDKSEEDLNKKDLKNKSNFVNKNPFVKIFILAAGVLMNFILAYLLITASFYIGTTFQVDRNSAEYKQFSSEGRIRNEYLVISQVVNNSPAKNAGLTPGLRIEKIYLNEESSVGKVASKQSVDLRKNGDEVAQDISEKLNSDNIDSMTIVYLTKKGIEETTTISGVYGLGGNIDKKLTGLSFTKFATINLSIPETIKAGYENTMMITKGTLVGFRDLFLNLFKKGEISSEISGPVGIFNMVSQASQFGFSYVLLFAAILSISLAIFNILPFPALDGGRILFVIIESVTHKKIPEKWQTMLNGVGFIILILLMVVVSVRDIMKFF
jgi:regulator of sigma E protease